MKIQLASIFILAVVITACKSNVNEDQIVDLEGNWLLKEVIVNTQSFKSIKKAVDLSDFYVTELVFDPAGDSVSVYNGQDSFVRLPVEIEGKGKYISVRNQMKPQLLFDEADSTLFFADSTLNRVYRFFKAEKKYVDTSFSFPVAFPSYVNEAMVYGDWVNESLGKVNFGLFGEIKNWSAFTSYEIVVNGAYALSPQSDLIILKSGDNAQLFGFKRNAESIQFYDLEPEPNGRLYKNGKLLYQFRHSLIP